MSADPGGITVDQRSDISSATNPPSQDIIGKEVQLGLAIFLCVALVIGVLGNVMTIYIIISRKKLRTSYNAYVANLAIADILLLAVNLPTTIMEFIQGDNNILYREYCTYTSLFNIMTMLCSLTSVTAVALNRFLVICCSKSTYEKFTRRRTVALSILLIWLYCFCLVSPPLAGYGTFAYHSKFRTCFFLANDEESRMYGVIFCCLLGVFPPVVASVFFYAKILLKLAQNKQNLQKHFLPPISQVIADMKKSSSNPNLEPASTNSSDELINTKQVAFTGVRKESESNGSRSSHKNSTKMRRQRSSAHSIRQNNRHRRTVLMLFVVFLNIVVCWAPISISFIADANSLMPSLVYVSFAILAWSSSCVNVFIYAGMNLTFRRAYIQVLTRPCNRGKMLTLSSGSGLESQTGTAQGGNLHLQTDNNGNTMR